MLKLCLTLILILLIRTTQNHGITKRALMFPRGTNIQFTYGLTVPLVLPRRSINFSICAQVNYDLPSNITRLTTPITIATRDSSGFFDISRKKFYKYIIKYLDSFGLEGEQCLLRAICEIAETPLHIRDEETLLEKIVHYVFTPSLEMKSTNRNATAKTELSFIDELLLAEKIGYNQRNCEEKYSECLVSLVDIFTSKYII